MEIRTGGLDHPSVVQLLGEHLQGMAQYSPPESIHALDPEALRKPEISFWTVWERDGLMGCGALKQLDSLHGEIKSMRTAAQHLRKGVASALVAHIVHEARRRGWQRLFLETGSASAFAPARRLYAGFGFEVCGPFASYVEDPYSVFMSKPL